MISWDNSTNRADGILARKVLCHVHCCWSMVVKGEINLEGKLLRVELFLDIAECMISNILWHNSTFPFYATFVFVLSMSA